jgi:cyanophycinase
VLAATGAERPRVVILPTAAAHYNPSKAASNGVRYFSDLGADASSMMVLGKEEAGDEALLAPVDTADVIYLSGGDPSHLLETLRGSILANRLQRALERGAVLAGSSAGAMVLGSWMRFREWTPALGILAGLAVLPHHEGSEPDAVARELEGNAPADTTVIGIDSETCCLGSADGWQALGPGAVTVYTQGRWRRYRSGESVPLPAPA